MWFAGWWSVHWIDELERRKRKNNRPSKEQIADVRWSYLALLRLRRRVLSVPVWDGLMLCRSDLRVKSTIYVFSSCRFRGDRDSLPSQDAFLWRRWALKLLRTQRKCSILLRLPTVLALALPLPFPPCCISWLEFADASYSDPWRSLHCSYFWKMRSDGPLQQPSGSFLLVLPTWIGSSGSWWGTISQF
jgi:hypothetical protein